MEYLSPSRCKCFLTTFDTAPDVPLSFLEARSLVWRTDTRLLPNDIADKIPHLRDGSFGGATEGGIWSIFTKSIHRIRKGKHSPTESLCQPGV